MDGEDLADLIRAWKEREAREDLRFGIVGSVIANSNPYRERGSEAIHPSDLFASIPKPETANRVDLRSKIERLARSLGCEVPRGEQ